jgi:hypothetical protein
MKYKLKDYSQFLKEEVDLSKGNKGIPSDFMRNAEAEATKNLGVSIDKPGPTQIGSLMSQSTRFITTQGLDTSSENYAQDLENRYKKLEDLAKKVILDEYGAILETSEKPVELLIKLIRPSESVIGELPKLGQKTEISEDKPDFEEEEDQEKQEDQYSQESQEDEDHDPESQDEEEDDFFKFFGDESQEEEEEHEEEDSEEITNKDVAFAIDKTKILNMITQGEGKATKDIIKLSETVSNGLMEIFGDSYRTILDIWSKTSDEADKLDWNIPVGQKQQLFKELPGGIAGAVDLAWESLDNKQYKFKLLKENSEFNKIVIRAYGVDFPMLIHETVKGIYMLLQSSAIKSNPELAEEIKRATSSYRDEAQDFRYGPLAQAMFRDFINKFDDANKYPNMKEKVYAILAADKRRGGKFTDEEFLKITKDIFSSFDKVEESGKVKFVINSDRFNESFAKQKIEDIIREANDIEDEYQEELRKWELEQQFGASDYDDDKKDDEDYPQPEKEEESDIDRLVRQSLEKPEEQTEEQDLANLTQRELQELIDDALDREDYAEVKKLSAYLENANIYLKELERIFEFKKYERK